MTTPEQLPPDRDHWDCAMIRDMLPLYIDDEVSPDSKSLIVEHLANCTHCADFLAGAQNTLGRLPQGRNFLPTVHIAKDPPPQGNPSMSHAGAPSQRSAAIQMLLGVTLLSIGIVWLRVYLFIAPMFGEHLPPHSSSIISTATPRSLPTTGYSEELLLSPTVLP